MTDYGNYWEGCWSSKLVLACVHTHTGTFNFSCNVVNLNKGISCFFFFFKFYFPNSLHSTSILSEACFHCSEYLISDYRRYLRQCVFCSRMGLHSFAHFVPPPCFVTADAFMFAKRERKKSPFCLLLTNFRFTDSLIIEK